MHDLILNSLDTIIEKIRNDDMSYKEILVISSLLSLYNNDFPCENKNTLKYLFTGWYVHKMIDNE